MNEYIHLTENERYQIYSFLKEKFSIAKIAKNLDRNRSTIYREIRRILVSVLIDLNKHKTNAKSTTF